MAVGYERSPQCADRCPGPRALEQLRCAEGPRLQGEQRPGSSGSSQYCSPGYAEMHRPPPRSRSCSSRLAQGGRPTVFSRLRTSACPCKPLAEPREDRPVSHARPFARRATSFALVLESFAIVPIGGKRRRHRFGNGRSSRWTANAHFQGARNQHRQAALRRPLKNCGGACRADRSRGIHVRSIGNRVGHGVFNTTQPFGHASQVTRPAPSQSRRGVCHFSTSRLASRQRSPDLSP